MTTNTKNWLLAFATVATLAASTYGLMEFFHRIPEWLAINIGAAFGLLFVTWIVKMNLDIESERRS